MDSWSQDQLKKMQAGGNSKLNAFLGQYGIAKDTDIAEKYNSKAAEVGRRRAQCSHPTLHSGRCMLEVLHMPCRHCMPC